MNAYCLLFSAKGAKQAFALQKAFAWRPWFGISELLLYAPEKMAKRNTELAGLSVFASLAEFMGGIWPAAAFIIFVGAAGIAVRAIAPFLRHKSQDPAVVVVDSQGHFAISLLSGHLGGANALTRHIAAILHCQAVITTASDIAKNLALDLWLRDAGLRIVDWRELPAKQALLLEGKSLAICDPWGAVPEHPQLQTGHATPDLVCHWRHIPHKAGVLRVAAPIIHMGIGFRKNLAPELLLDAVARILQKYRLEPKALAAFATVAAKAQEPALLALAKAYNLSVNAFAPAVLAAIPVPHPSRACGERFGQTPFSVCEGAALASSGGGELWTPKVKVGGCMTFAIALSKVKNRRAN